VYDWGLRIHQSHAIPVLGLSPTWEARYSEIRGFEAVETGGLQLHNTGIRIKAVPPGAPLVFWSKQFQEILGLVQRMGGSVDSSVHTLPGRRIE
jgi:hypothetical protein